MRFTKFITQLQLRRRNCNSSPVTVRQLQCSRPFASMRLLLSSLRSSSSSTIAYPYLVPTSLVNYSSHAPSLSTRPKEQSRKVWVSVWWDIESCNLPTGVDEWDVRCRIMDALNANCIYDVIQFNVFGDILQFSDPDDIPVRFNHIPNGSKNILQRSLLFNLLYWVSKNPPPSHLLLISDDRDLAYVLPHLRKKNYNILLATNDSASDVLRSAASITWCWNSLARGENLVVAHLN